MTMKSLFRTTSLLIAIGLATGCSGPRRFERQAGSVRLPSAPVLEPSPEASYDPDKVGTVGAPQPAREGVPAVPTLSPFGD
jgi:hypothetical protein